jgi:hypothetical protein
MDYCGGVEQASVIGDEGVDEKDGTLFTGSPRPKVPRAVGNCSYKTLPDRRSAMKETVTHPQCLDRQDVYSLDELRARKDPVALRAGVQYLLK